MNMNVNEIYDLLLEMELGPPAAGTPAGGRAEAVLGGESGGAAVEAGSGEADAAEAAEPSRLTGFGRYRNAALVGAGGLACAAVGALLGGMGGYFTVAPASAHAVGATAQDTPLADAINGAASHSGQMDRGSGASGLATLADVEGSLTKGISSFSVFSADPSANGAGTAGSSSSGGAGALGSGGAGSGGSGGSGAGCASGDAGLASLVDNVTCTLAGIGSLPGSGTAGLSSLGALVGQVTGTLSGLSGLTGSLATSTGLPLPSGSGGSGALGLPATGSLTGVVNTVTAVAEGATGKAGSSLPLPTSGRGSGSGSSPTLPSLPVTTPTLPGLPGAPTLSSTGGSTTVAVPTPSVPVPVGTTITIGGVSVGVNTGGSSPGATLNLP
jgi:hypothetical protein